MAVTKELVVAENFVSNGLWPRPAPLSFGRSSIPEFLVKSADDNY